MHVLMRRVVLQYLFVVLLDDLLQGFRVSIHQPLVLLLGGQRMDSMDAVKYHTNQRTRWKCIGKTHGSLSAQFCATNKEGSEKVPAINNEPHVIQPSGAQHKNRNLSRNRCKYCAGLEERKHKDARSHDWLPTGGGGESANDASHIIQVYSRNLSTPSNVSRRFIEVEFSTKHRPSFRRNTGRASY